MKRAERDLGLSRDECDVFEREGYLTFEHVFDVNEVRAFGDAYDSCLDRMREEQ